MEGRSEIAAVILLILLTMGLAASLPSSRPASAETNPTFADHDPIVIHGNAAFTAANGIVAGNGSAEDPYEIWGWFINSATGMAIRLEDTTAYVVIRDLEVWGTIRLDAVRHAHLENTTVREGSIVVAGANEVVLRGNTVMNGSIGVTLPLVSTYPTSRSSHGILVDANTLRSRQWDGIDVELDNVTVSRNTVIWAHFGIYVRADNVSIVGNDISLVSGAVELDTTHNVTLRSNYLHAFQSGVFALFPDNLTMVDNVLSCGDHSFLCDGSRSFYSVNSTRMLAYHNRFLTVYETARDQSGILDRWDNGYPAGGNYWVNYTGRDSCRGANQTDCSLGDGIGDTPYRIVGGSAVDRYPLQLEPVSDTPTIVTTPPSSLTQGESYTFEARVGDSGGIHNVTLYYGTSLLAEDHVVPMTLGTDGAYQATVVVPTDAGWLEYYIQASDLVGNTANFPSTTFGNDAQLVPVNDPYAWLGFAGFLVTVAVLAAALILVLRGRRPRLPVMPPPADVSRPGAPGDSEAGRGGLPTQRDVRDSRRDL